MHYLEKMIKGAYHCLRRLGYAKMIETDVQEPRQTGAGGSVSTSMVSRLDNGCFIEGMRAFRLTGTKFSITMSTYPMTSMFCQSHQLPDHVLRRIHPSNLSKT